MNPEPSRTENEIDWSRARGFSNQGEGRPSNAEAVQAILEERARALAMIPPCAPLASEVLHLAAFALKGERYAIEARFVRRIGRLSHYTPVPGAPALLLGVFNSGGEIIPLFDLASLFGADGGETSGSTRLVVLGEDREEFGLLVDGADEVLVVRLDQILPPSSFSDNEGRSLIRGITEDALIVIDGEHLLADERLMIDQGIEA